MSEPFRRPADDEDPDDPFYWGRRWVWVESPEGRRLEEIPLTREDVLDPQEGDSMVQNAAHSMTIRQLAEMLVYWFRRQGRAMTVFNDMKVRWGVPGLPGPAPDIAVIPASVDLSKGLGSYLVGTNGPLPCLVIEVASNRYAPIDYGDKVEVYERAGVPEYLILEVDRRPLSLTSFQRGPGGRYRQGRSHRRWQSRTTGLLFVAGATELSVRDAATGERLQSSWELDEARRIADEARRIADEARHAAERRAAVEAAARRRLEAELERLRRGRRP